VNNARLETLIGVHYVRRSINLPTCHTAICRLACIDK